LVQHLHALAIARGEDAIRWYDTGRGRKKRLGVALRLLAIIFTAAAGLHPLFHQVFMFDDQFGSPVVPSIFVATAALFILFDRFGGHTSGWIRFMRAQTSIDQALAAYKAGWLAERGVDAEPDSERTDRLLQRSVRLIRDVDRIVRDETDEWVAEFRRAHAESERAAEEARRRLDSGSLEVIATNHAAIPSDQWTLQVSDGPERVIHGARAAETGVGIGVHPVRGSVRLNGLVYQDERAVDVRPGAVTFVELTFPIPPESHAHATAGGDGAGRNPASGTGTQGNGQATGNGQPAAAAPRGARVDVSTAEVKESARERSGRSAADNAAP
jgi:hypothetical protein